MWSPIYGNCFNIFAADESFGKSSLTGASYGLSLELQVVIIKTLPVLFKVKLKRQKKAKFLELDELNNQSLNSAQVLEDDFLGDHDQYRILARCRKTTTWEVGKRSPLAFESPSR